MAIARGRWCQLARVDPSALGPCSSWGWAASDVDCLFLGLVGRPASSKETVSVPCSKMLESFAMWQLYRVRLRVRSDEHIKFLLGVLYLSGKLSE